MAAGIRLGLNELKSKRGAVIAPRVERIIPMSHDTAVRTASDTLAGPQATAPVVQPGFAPEARAELVQRASELIPLLRKHANWADENRRVHPETIEALKEAGIFRMWVPRRYGGYEADMRTHVDVTRELARGCASTAWVVGLITSCAFNASLFSRQVQDEIFGVDPDARVAGALDGAGTARRAPGGWTIDGTWGVASGCLHAEWIALAAPMLDDGGNIVNLGFFLAPVGDVTIKDTWYTVGMRGTGSNAIAAQEIFVPEHRAVGLLGPEGFIDQRITNDESEVLYRVKLGSMASLAEVGTQLGLGVAALETALEQISKRKISYTIYERQTDATATHLDIARAATMIDAAQLLVYRAAADADAAAFADSDLDLLTRGRIRADCSYASWTVRQAVDIIMMMCGAGGMAQSNSLQQIWRDLSTVTLHALMRPAVTDEVYGRLLCGLPASVTPVL